MGARRPHNKTVMGRQDAPATTICGNTRRDSMRTSRTWMVTAVVGLACISFLWGCGSERKAEAPPVKAVETPKNVAPAPKPMMAKPKSTDETEPTSDDLTIPKFADSAEPKPLVKARPKLLMKKSEPLNPGSAKPAEPLDAAPPPPQMADERINPMRSAPAEPSDQSSPIEAENPLDKISSGSVAPSIVDESPAGFGSSESKALSEAEAKMQESKMFLMQESEKAAAAAPSEPKDSLEPSKAEGEYTVVKVFYGTDRAQINSPATNQPVYILWLWRTMVAASVALFFAIFGFQLYPSRLLRVVAYCGMFITGILAGLTFCARIQSPVPVDAGMLSTAASVSYGADRGKLEFGTCEVSIPKSHDVGELESPSVLRLEFQQDPMRHVILHGVHNEPAEEFFANLNACVDRSPHKAAFVFVHGYNTKFEDAARRTAQIAYDLKFDGAPIFYSWPSQGGLLQYAVDETNVTWTAPHLLQFLTDVAQRSGAEQIHLVAHSMGNRALTSALRDIALMNKSSKPLFNEVVLTAPDIDAEVFINDIAPAIVKTAQRVTLYASSNDEALIMSKKVHGYARAGDSGSQLIVVPGVDTVDVSAVDTSLLGHNYYGDNSTVLADIFELLNASKPADQRHWLLPKRLGLLKYWYFQR
jgi:esterase/lipase superfamily enzyme